MHSLPLQQQWYISVELSSSTEKARGCADMKIGVNTVSNLGKKKNQNSEANRHRISAYLHFRNSDSKQKKFLLTNCSQLSRRNSPNFHLRSK